MELIGKIIQILPQESGVSKSSGKEWVKASYVLETQEQYPRKVKYDVFGEQRIKDCEVQIDDEVKMSIDIESREYQGRWYTSVNAYKVEFNLDGVQEQAQAAQTTTPPATQPVVSETQEDYNGNLPF